MLPIHAGDLARRRRCDSKILMIAEDIEAIRPAAVVPPVLVSWLAMFRRCFTASVWNHILVLVAGAGLARQMHRHPGGISLALGVSTTLSSPLGRSRRGAEAAAASALPAVLCCCGAVVLWPSGDGRQHGRTALGCQDQGSGIYRAGAVRRPALGEAGQGSAGVAGRMPDEGWQAILQTKRRSRRSARGVCRRQRFRVLELIAAI
jgi:hypothetical protein